MAVTNNGGGGFETKAAVNQVFSRRPCPEIGRKRGAAGSCSDRALEGQGIEYGNWMVGGGWVDGDGG